MIRLLFLLSGVYLLYIGPFSYKPQPITYLPAKHDTSCPANAHNCLSSSTALHRP